MPARRPYRFAVAAALAFAIVAPSATASADWISLSSGSKDDTPGFLGWALTVGAVVGASVPMGAAAGTAFYRTAEMSRAAGGGTLALGVGLGVPAGVGLGYVKRDEWGTILPLLDGMLWNLTGVGIGTLIDPTGHAGWIGGGMGFAGFSLFHGAIAMGGLDDSAPAGVVQAVYGAFGAAACFGDAAVTSGTLRSIGIGCGAASSVGMIHGIVMAAIAPPLPRAAPRRRRAVVPVPWVNGRAAGVSLAGAF